MFGRLYVSELKKTAKPKLIIIFSIIGVVLMIISMLANILISDLLDIDYNEEEVITTSTQIKDVAIQKDGDVENVVSILDYLGYEFYPTVINVDKQECENMLTLYDELLKEARDNAQKDPYGYYTGIWTRVDEDSDIAFSILGNYLGGGSGDEIYSARAGYNIMKYIQDNGLYNKNIVVYEASGGSYSADAELCAEGLISSMISIFSSVAMIFAIVIGAGAVSNEIKRGTLKLVFIRPVTRTKFLGAKILSGLTLVTLFYTMGYLVATILGYVIKPASSATMMFAFNSTDVYLGSASLGIFYGYIFGLIQLFTYYILAFAVGTLSKKIIAGIIVPLFISLPQTLFTIATLGRFWVSDAMSLGNYFGYGVDLIGGSHFAISFLVLMAYLVAITSITIVVFRKRDIA